jgi:hypothetical protein
MGISVIERQIEPGLAFLGMSSLAEWNCQAQHNTLVAARIEMCTIDRMCPCPRSDGKKACELKSRPE